MNIELKEVRFFEAIPALGLSDYIYKRDKPEGARITATDIGVVLEAPGFDDVLVFGSMCKSAIALDPHAFGSLKSQKKVEKLKEIESLIAEQVSRKPVEAPVKVEILEVKKTEEITKEIVAPKELLDESIPEPKPREEIKEIKPLPVKGEVKSRVETRKKRK